MSETVRAAGGLVCRRREDGANEILLVHRPAYDDWSFPKGKLEPGEREEDVSMRAARDRRSPDERQEKVDRTAPVRAFGEQLGRLDRMVDGHRERLECLDTAHVGARDEPRELLAREPHG